MLKLNTDKPSVEAFIDGVNTLLPAFSITKENYDAGNITFGVPENTGSETTPEGAKYPISPTKVVITGVKDTHSKVGTLNYYRPNISKIFDSYSFDIVYDYGEFTEVEIDEDPDKHHPLMLSGMAKNMREPIVFSPGDYTVKKTGTYGDSVYYEYTFTSLTFTGKMSVGVIVFPKMIDISSLNGQNLDFFIVKTDEKGPNEGTNYKKLSIGFQPESMFIEAIKQVTGVNLRYDYKYINGKIFYSPREFTFQDLKAVDGAEWEQGSDDFHYMLSQVTMVPDENSRLYEGGPVTVKYKRANAQDIRTPEWPEYVEDVTLTEDEVASLKSDETKIYDLILKHYKIYLNPADVTLAPLTFSDEHRIVDADFTDINALNIMGDVTITFRLPEKTPTDIDLSTLDNKVVDMFTL